MSEKGALDGIKVLALENFIAGPVASMWLADAGAEVVKIERPPGGDQSRQMPPFEDADGERRGLSFIRANRNKSSMVLDLQLEEGREVFRELADKADVVLENLNPTAMERLGLGPLALRANNPELVYVSISGFGREDSLLSHLTAFDIVAQAMGGLMRRPSSADGDPVYLGFPVADLYAATLAVAGTYQALLARSRGQGGAFVDVALLDGAVALNELSVILYSALGTISSPGLHALTAPFGTYAARDGFVALGVIGEPIWQRFATAIDKPELADHPELADGISRHRNQAKLMEEIGPWLAARTVDEVIEHLSQFSVPCAPVYDADDVVESDHLRKRGMMVDIDDPAWGSVTVAGNPIRSSAAGPTRTDAPPELGRDSERVLTEWLGYDPSSIERLRETGVLQGEPVA